MSPTRILSLVAAALLALAPVVAAEPPATKPCCCCDEFKPCATTCPAQTPTTAVVPCCCCEAAGCCAACKCCDVKTGCECKDCCCSKGCCCSKSKGVVKVAPGCCSASGFATEATPACPCLPPRPLRTAVVAPLPPAPPFPPAAFSRPMMPLPEPLALGYPLPPAYVPTPPVDADVLEMQAMRVPKWVVKAATSRGETSLEITQDEACKITGEKFQLTVGQDSFAVTVRDKQVAITGDILKGVADRVTRTPNTDQIVLEGNVKATYSKGGQKAELSGGTVVVDLAEGSVQVKPAKSEEVQLFQFIMGFWN